MNNSYSDQLSKSILKTLNESIELSGKASLVVCGGNSPLSIYQKLSLADLDWNNVSIYLGDDRLLPSEHIDSNENLLRKNLLINNAKSAKFHPLVQPRIDIKNIILPFDIVLLGLGLDGHFASLFPEQVKLSSAFSIDADPDLICSEIPLGSPRYKRISMNQQLSAKAANFQGFLSSRGIEEKVVELSESTVTSAEADAAIGCEVEEIAKSIVFYVKDTLRPILVIASGTNRVDEKS